MWRARRVALSCRLVDNHDRILGVHAKTAGPIVWKGPCTLTLSSHTQPRLWQYLQRVFDSHETRLASEEETGV